MEEVGPLGAVESQALPLDQVARVAGARVVGTASAKHHDAVRALGAVPVDYRAPGPEDRLRAHAPRGYDAVFDHVGGEGIVTSWRLLAARGTLVSYGTASTRDVQGSSRAPVLKLLARLTLWNTLPNGKGAHFYNIWAGRRRPGAFRARLHADLSQVFALLADGELTAQVAARVPLTEVGEAVRLAESGSVVGKVVLVPQAHATAEVLPTVPSLAFHTHRGGGCAGSTQSRTPRASRARLSARIA
ncbi:zinc-binding dehydrogenase [Streptomyces sp. NPDC085946]|uniref:zinc-binding dehydrogenase n=1 Tax=Streptomyces sp. NPDC085946 TaxID=3365744 RepID=UPI0037D575D1